jgi:ATP/maltotriose-dependent transcriptional regulator MalT
VRVSDPSKGNGDVTPREAGHSTSATLVGRDRDLDQLVSASAPSFILIEGDAGIGKTRLIAELRRRPEVAESRFLVGACQRIREPLPLRPVVAAVRQLRADLPTLELPPVVGALRPLLPELVEELPTAPEPLSDHTAERHRLFRGLRDLLAAAGPVVVAIDDVQWIDELTVDFLRYLMAEPPSNLTLVVAYRGEEAPSGVQALRAALPESVDQTHLTLRRLKATETAAMAADLLGIDELSDDVAAFLHEWTSGLPYAVHELLDLLHARGIDIRSDEARSREDLAELDVPRLLRDQVAERLGRLTDSGRSVVEAAATLELPATLSTLVGACITDDHDALRGVDEALESGLLVERGDALGFRHMLVGQAVYSAMPMARKHQLHRQAATSLEQLWPVPLGQVAYHRRASGQLAEWIQTAERAADRAADAGDDAEAARHLDTVLREAPLEPEQRTRLAVKLGRVALDAANQSSMIAPLSDALRHEESLPKASRGKLHFWLGLLMDQTGYDPQRQRQRQLFAKAVDELDDQPELQASAMISLASGTQSRVSERLSWVRRAHEILPGVDDPAYEVYLQSKIGGVMVLAGDPDWRQAADRITEQTRGHPRHRHEVRAYSTIANCAAWAGHLDVARDWLGRAESAPVAHRDERLALRLRANAAVLDFCRGQWVGLRERADRFVAQFAGRPRIRVDVDVVAGRLALAEGDIESAERRLADLRGAIEKLDASDLLPMATEAEIRLALARGDPAVAMEVADRMRAVIESEGFWLSTTRAIPAVVEAMIAASRADQVGPWLATMGRELRELDAPQAPAALEHAYGLLAIDESRWDAAVGHLRTAAARYDALGCCYETAQANELAARAQLIAEPPAAEPVLRAAATTYRDLGARHDLDRITSIARVHGVSLPSQRRGGRRGYGRRLSPREREVAELAAAGHTNKEIADKLFVSINTVKKQLSAAMRKLGVRSRDALSHQLGVTSTR